MGRVNENCKIIYPLAFSGCSWPIGSLIIPNSVTSIGDWAFDLKRTTSLVTLGSSNLAAATTLTATPDAKLPKGAIMYVKFQCGSTKYDVTVKKSSEDTGVTIVGVASSTVCKSVLWDGTNWIVVG